MKAKRGDETYISERKTAGEGERKRTGRRRRAQPLSKPRVRWSRALGSAERPPGAHSGRRVWFTDPGLVAVTSSQLPCMESGRRTRGVARGLLIPGSLCVEAEPDEGAEHRRAVPGCRAAPSSRHRLLSFP